MRSTRTTTTTLLTALCGLAMPAWAMPAALDRAPADAPIVVGINDIGELLDDLERVGAMAGPNANVAGPTQAIGFLRGMKGLDRGRSAAMVITELPEGYTSPKVALIIPVTSFAEFGANAEATEVDGLRRLAIGDTGEEGYMRDLGDGWAVLAETPEAASSFDGSAGRLAAHKATLGVNGGRVADSSDLVLYANMDVLRPAMKQAVDGFRQQMGFFAAMAGGTPQITGGLNTLMAVAEGFTSDAQCGVLGVNISEDAVSFDLASQFKPGSQVAGFFQHAGDTGALVSRLPEMPFYMAYSMDLGGDGVAKLFENYLSIMEAAGVDTTEGLGGMNPAMFIGKAKGTSGVLGTSPALMMGGVMQNFVTYTAADDGSALVATTGEMLAGMNGKTMQGMLVTSAFAPAAEQIAGVPVATYEFKAIPADDGQANQFGGGMVDPRAINQMIFGTNLGPRGYMASTEGGLVQTVSRDKALMEKALNAAKDGGGLGSADAFRKAAAALPEGRSFELFFSVDQIANTAGPFLMMGGQIEQFEPLDALPLIAVGGTTTDGGVLIRTHLPFEAMKKLAEFAPQPGMAEEPIEAEPRRSRPSF